MTFTKKLTVTASALALVGTMAAAQTYELESGAETNADIATSAAGVENLSTLVAAVDAAGLTETLMGEGPFTVFAPIDAAFEGVPVETLLLDENKAMLTDILTTHVVAGSYTAFELEQMVLEAENFDDQFVYIETVSGERLRIGDAAGEGRVVLFDPQGNAIDIITSDITATNGIVHAIDGVIMPDA